MNTRPRTFVVVAALLFAACGPSVLEDGSCTDLAS